MRQNGPVQAPCIPSLLAVKSETMKHPTFVVAGHQWLVTKWAAVGSHNSKSDYILDFEPHHFCWQLVIGKVTEVSPLKNDHIWIHLMTFWVCSLTFCVLLDATGIAVSASDRKGAHCTKHSSIGHTRKADSPPTYNGHWYRAAPLGTGKWMKWIYDVYVWYMFPNS